MNGETATAILHDVRVLVERAWTQGAYCRLTDGGVLALSSKLHLQPERPIAYCLQGALDVTCLRYDQTLAESETLRELLVELIGLNPGKRSDEFALEHWNDAYGRTLDEVLQLIDAAIARLQPVLA